MEKHEKKPNRHQRGVARSGAVPVIENLGAVECPARTERALVPARTRAAVKPSARQKKITNRKSSGQ